MIKQCPPNKIINPITNRCVKIDGTIGKKLIKTDLYNPTVIKIPKNKNNVVYSSNSNIINNRIKPIKCLKRLKNVLNQCDCPICWIVSSIVAIKYSNIHKLLTPEYKKIVKDAYNIFISGKDNKLCPYIPPKVYKEYIKHVELDDNDTLFNELLKNRTGGSSLYFIYVLLKNALKIPYKIDYYNSFDNNIRILENHDPNKFIVYKHNLYPPIILDQELNLGKIVLSKLKMLQTYYNSLGYIFDSGILVLRHTESKNSHAVAFSYCNKKYYICNSDNRKCESISGSNYRKIGYIFYEYNSIHYINLILTSIK